MTRREKLRSELFKKYSYNLDLIKKYDFINLEPNIPKSYICPLCIRLFTEKDLDQAVKNCLTLEDIPPKSLGGKPILLTCKECNNESGTKLDEQLRKKLTFDEFNQKVPGSQVDAKMTFASSLSTSCALSHRGDGGLSVHMFKNGLKAKKGKRECFPRVVEDIRENGFGEMNFSIKTYKQKHHEIALLRIAYLLAFVKFGYSFLFNDNLPAIRQQILNPGQEIIKHFANIVSDKSNYDEGVYIIVRPEELQSFLVIFKLFNGKQETLHSIVLPGFSQNGQNIYEIMKNYHSCHGNLDFQIRMVPNKDYFTDKQLCLGPQILWDLLKK